MHNRIRFQQECIESICDILGPDVYEPYEGSGHRTRLQQAILETQQRIYPSAEPLTMFEHYKKQLKRHHDEAWDVAHDIALSSVTPDIA